MRHAQLLPYLREQLYQAKFHALARGGESYLPFLLLEYKNMKFERLVILLCASRDKGHEMHLRVCISASFVPCPHCRSVVSFFKIDFSLLVCQILCG